MQDRDYTQMEVAEKLSKAVQKKTMARSFVQQSSSFGGRRGGMPVQYVLQATNIEKLQEVLPKFMAKVRPRTRVPNGRRRFEIQQTGSTHQHQPR